MFRRSSMLALGGSLLVSGAAVAYGDAWSLTITEGYDPAEDPRWALHPTGAGTQHPIVVVPDPAGGDGNALFFDHFAIGWFTFSEQEVYGTLTMRLYDQGLMQDVEPHLYSSWNGPRWTIRKSADSNTSTAAVGAENKWRTWMDGNEVYSVSAGSDYHQGFHWTAATFFGDLVRHPEQWNDWTFHHPDANTLLLTLNDSITIDLHDINQPLGNWAPPDPESGFAGSQGFDSVHLYGGQTSSASGLWLQSMSFTPAGPVAVQWDVDANGNWSNADNWSDAVPNAAGAAALFGPVITEARTVTVDAPQIVGSLSFNNANSYTLDGSSAITVETTSGTGMLQVETGSHTISAPVILASNLAVNVTAGDSVLTVNDLTATGHTLSKTGQGMWEVNNISSEGIVITGGTVRVLPDGTLAGASEIGGFMISENAALDLTDNEIVIQNVNVATVSDAVASGRAGGSWDGSGITSSVAAAEGDRALGVGQSGDDVLVRFTYSGDANLDRSVTIADLGILAANWQGIDKFWFEGDFNYDTQVTIADLGILAANWQKGTSGGGMSFEEAMAMFDVFDGVVVPEPAAISMLGLAGVLALRRRQ